MDIRKLLQSKAAHQSPNWGQAPTPEPAHPQEKSDANRKKQAVFNLPANTMSAFATPPFGAPSVATEDRPSTPTGTSPWIVTSRTTRYWSRHQITPQASKRQMARIVEVLLTAKEQDLVLEQRLMNGSKGR
jgi:hypothetical protein